MKKRHSLTDLVQYTFFFLSMCVCVCMCASFYIYMYIVLDREVNLFDVYNVDDDDDGIEEKIVSGQFIFQQLSKGILLLCSIHIPIAQVVLYSKEHPHVHTNRLDLVQKDFGAR